MGDLFEDFWATFIELFIFTLALISAFLCAGGVVGLGFIVVRGLINLIWS